MTLKEWKACFQPGVQVEQVRNGQGECLHTLTVTKVQSNAIRFTNNSNGRPGWIDFPKLNEIVFTESGWQRLKEPGGSEVLSEYRWVKGEEHTD